MNVKRKHPCDHYAEGRCSLGLHGGKPSPAVCIRRCQSFSGSERRRAKERVRLEIKVDAMRSTTTWLGIRWIGKPFPKRFRPVLRWGWCPWLKYEPYKGCGCVRTAKILAVTIFGRRWLV